MREALALFLCVLTLGACASGKVVLMQDPRTGTLFECRGDANLDGSFESEPCAKALEKQGWRRLSERVYY